jgi:intracellular sulfur oxidation DsrE/DsrF family protein
MTSKAFSATSKRRSFLTRFSAGVTAFATTMVAGAAAAQSQAPPVGRWQPERHEKDDWLDQLPGKHRLVFDTTKPDGFGEAITFAGNFIRVNLSDYGVPNSELATVIVARSRSTPFAYNDGIWAKYGIPIASRAGFTDPKTKEAPKVNVYTTTLDSLVKQGVQLAVCQVATRNFAGAIAQAIGGKTDSIYEELVANIVSNARMVPAGIVAVNRAQERGYSLVTT